MTLIDGRKGDLATIIAVHNDQKTKKRLQDMGITKGAQVKVMSVYGKNAYILKIRGSRVVLGADVAAGLEVELDHVRSKGEQGGREFIRKHLTAKK
ncbi:FeoA family protein [Anaerotalea alkaliphila]|uniref:Ferrous iron transport protein A n=1 Tax=Anaerotalea alkaliphila TaxID=2662126 RepID=A0A7X5KLY7_9FIRM|nr:FeoA family protein [Anaerotalea alkaliphila]NDL67366.1 ferrous iron transport protein A [Anaerotalea alkaliphila]